MVNVTGTIAVKNGASLVRGSGTEWDDDLKRLELQVVGEPAIYSIAQVDSATQLTLGEPYAGTTGDEKGYLLWQKKPERQQAVKWSARWFYDSARILFGLSVTGFKGPVRWLLGRQLISSLKGIALYSGFGDKLTPKDWMQGEIISFGDDQAKDGEFWFDYIADSGDGQMATYSIAYLCLSELGVKAAASVGSNVSVNKNDSEHDMTLPRGAFLFVGGDTSYHIADYPTLAERFQDPFRWAFRDLQAAGKLSTDPATRCQLFGIPGNHDYYDALDGFHRQFRRPLTQENQANRRGQMPQLSIFGFKRCQAASFVALQLPFGWWLWGVDAQEGKIDLRQEEFFRGISPKGVPDKLIVATPTPTTVFGKCAEEKKPDEKPGWKSKMVGLFERLDLERLFLKDGQGLGQGKCRLDLSGDVHHYARYWGGAQSASPNGANYASVVSGLGGAFLHPTQTDVGKVGAQVLYPSKDDSQEEVARRLFNPLIVIGGGYVCLVGAMIALITYFAATVAPSTQSLVDALLPEPVRIAGGAGRISTELTTGTGLFADLRRTTFNIGDGVKSFGEIFKGGEWLLLLAAILLTVASGWYSHRRFRRARKQVVKWYQYWPVGLMLFLAGLCYVGVVFWADREAKLNPFFCSLMVLLFQTIALLAVVWSSRYSTSLFKQANKRTVKVRDYVLVAVLLVYAAVSLFFGVWQYGRYSAAVLLSDLTFAVVVLAVVVGLIVLAYKVGGRLCGTGGKIGFGVLGAVHAVLQLAVPFLLIRVGTWWTLAGALVSVGVFAVIGYVIARRNHRRWLVVTGLIYGGWMFYLPLGFSSSSLQMPYWVTLVAVFVLGFLMSCVWLGWYLAVSLAFNGHNNEAGGAARIERFKQLIRFRVRENDLTGFVIAVDDPQTDGSKLKPRLVDVFTLSVKP